MEEGEGGGGSVTLLAEKNYPMPKDMSVVQTHSNGKSKNTQNSGSDLMNSNYYRPKNTYSKTSHSLLTLIDRQVKYELIKETVNSY